jgi:hypothetical protein
LLALVNKSRTAASSLSYRYTYDEIRQLMSKTPHSFGTMNGAKKFIFAQIQKKLMGDRINV